MSIIDTCRREGGLGIHELNGEKSFDEAKETWETIRKNIQNDHLQAVMILDRTRSRLSVVEVVDIEQWLSEISFPRTIKVAIVDAKTVAENNNLFGETVVRNRGWPLITVFATEAAARTWLGIGS